MTFIRRNVVFVTTLVYIVMTVALAAAIVYGAFAHSALYPWVYWALMVACLTTATIWFLEDRSKRKRIAVVVTVSIGLLYMCLALAAGHSWTPRHNGPTYEVVYYFEGGAVFGI